jgi:hypothetical protein
MGHKIPRTAGVSTEIRTKHITGMLPLQRRVSSRFITRYHPIILRFIVGLTDSVITLSGNR